MGDYDIDPRYMQPVSDPEDEKLRQQIIQKLRETKENRRQLDIEEERNILDKMMNDRPMRKGRPGQDTSNIAQGPWYGIKRQLG